jgi:hypothetical protein
VQIPAVVIPREQPQNAHTHTLKSITSMRMGVSSPQTFSQLPHHFGLPRIVQYDWFTSHKSSHKIESQVELTAFLRWGVGCVCVEVRGSVGRVWPQGQPPLAVDLTFVFETERAAASATSCCNTLLDSFARTFCHNFTHRETCGNCGRPTLCCCVLLVELEPLVCAWATRA